MTPNKAMNLTKRWNLKMVCDGLGVVNVRFAGYRQCSTDREE
jgi:hypothetical protein